MINVNTPTNSIKTALVWTLPALILSAALAAIIIWCGVPVHLVWAALPLMVLYARLLYQVMYFYAMVILVNTSSYQSPSEDVAE